MKKITTLFTVFALAFATIALSAKDHHGKKHKERTGFPGAMCDGKSDKFDKRMNKMARKLNFTANQKKKLIDIQEKQKTAMKAQCDKARPMEENLRNLLKADKVDLAAVRKQLDDIAKVNVEKRMLGIQTHLEFEAILTKEQKQAMKEKREKKMQKHERKMKKKDSKMHDHEDDDN